MRSNYIQARSRMADETTRTDDRRAWTDDPFRGTRRETDGHGTKENKVGVCTIVKKVSSVYKL